MRDAINHRILISGLGSIGRRHLANLEFLGYTEIAFHRSGNPTIKDPLPDFPSYRDLDLAIAEFKPTAIFVCGPSHTHIEVAQKAVAAKIHVFIEKPLGHSLDGVAELERLAAMNNLAIMVGYMMRFHPLLLRIKEIINENRIGSLIHLRSQWGEYLPDWHPWEDYRGSYAAKRSMGGGPALTLSHEIDLALWFIGKPSSVLGLSNNSSALELDAEHGIDILIKSTTGKTANLHLDFYQRPPARTSEFVGTEGRISLDYYASRVEIFKPDQSEPVEVIDISESFERNNMFIKEVEHFLECIDKGITPLPTLAEGKTALAVALNALNS